MCNDGLFLSLMYILSAVLCYCMNYISLTKNQRTLIYTVLISQIGYILAITNLITKEVFIGLQLLLFAKMLWTDWGSKP